MRCFLASDGEYESRLSLIMAMLSFISFQMFINVENCVCISVTRVSISFSWPAKLWIGTIRGIWYWLWNIFLGCRITGRDDCPRERFGLHALEHAIWTTWPIILRTISVSLDFQPSCFSAYCCLQMLAWYICRALGEPSHNTVRLTSYRLSLIEDNFSASSLACECAFLVLSWISSTNSFRALSDNLLSARKSSRSRTSQQISMAASLQLKLLTMTGKRALTSTLVWPMNCLVISSFRGLWTSMSEDP